MGKLLVYTKEVEGKTYHYVDIGKGRHYRTQFRIWVDKDFVKVNRDYHTDQLYLPFTVQNCELKQGKKDLILKKGDLNFYYFVVECGYRGQSVIDDIIVNDSYQTFNFDIYSSETGSLGISQGVIVITKADKVKVKWHRSGRLYGKPAQGLTILYANGKQEEVEDDTILEDLKDLV